MAKGSGSKGGRKGSGGAGGRSAARKSFEPNPDGSFGAGRTKSATLLGSNIRSAVIAVQDRGDADSPGAPIHAVVAAMAKKGIGMGLVHRELAAMQQRGEAVLYGNDLPRAEHTRAERETEMTVAGGRIRQIVYLQ